MYVKNHLEKICKYKIKTRHLYYDYVKTRLQLTNMFLKY